MVPDDAPLLRRTLDLAFGARATSTWHQYAPKIAAFRLWCQQRGYTIVPAAPLHVAMWLTEIAGSAQSYGPVKMASAAVAALHEASASASRPTEDPLVKCVRRGAKREFGTAAVNRKEPLELGVCMAVAERLLQQGPAWAVMLAAYMMVSFAAFLRYDDASSILRKDVRFESTHAELFLARRKNDQFRQGSVVVVTRGSSAVCPVALLERWLEQAGSMQPDAFVFQAFSARDSSSVPSLSGEQLGYPQARYHVLAQLALHFELSQKEAASRFGLHSLRSGGATLCAVHEVDERLFQEHGGWRSKEAMHNYIQESLQHRMAPTAAMGY